MPNTTTVEIDPNDSMAGLEEGYVEEPVVETGAGAITDTTTTLATTSRNTETPEALAARVAAEAAARSEAQRAARSAAEVTSRENSQAGTNGAGTNAATGTNGANTSTATGTTVAGSLFDGAAAKPEGKVIEIADNDLVMLDGKLVPYGEVRTSIVFKPKYDQAVRERDALAAERASVAARDQELTKAEPFLKELVNNLYGRTYIQQLTILKSQGVDPALAEVRARELAEHATGTGKYGAAAGSQVAVDPRLVPPVDEDGAALAKDDPRYIEWRTGPYTEAVTEQTTNRVWNERQAEATRKAKAESDAQAERQAIAEKATADQRKIVDDNLLVLSHLGPELIARGIDVNAMTAADWRTAKEIFADQSKLYDKDIRDDNFLRTKSLTVGDVRAVLDSKDFLTKVKSLVGAGAGSGKGPETAAEVAAGAAGAAAAAAGAGANGAAGADAAGRLALQNNYARRPLNAGGPSDAVPASSAGIADADTAEEQIARAMESLG